MFSNRDSQTRQMIPVPRGNFAATTFTITRRNFTGDLAFIAKNLPAGVTMHAPKAPSNFSSIPILFRLKPMLHWVKPNQARLIIVNQITIKPLQEKYRHRVDLVYGPPNNRTYYEGTYDVLPVAVVEPVPFRVKLHTPLTPIVRGGSINLKVEIIRDANFTKGCGSEDSLQASGNWSTQ